MTQTHRDNLKKLADYLISGNLKAAFDMSYYEAWDNKKEHECGTVGCAAGHGPYAGIEKFPNESWNDYVQRAFGVMTTWSEDLSVFNYLFDNNWVEYDNTPEGAGKRILNFLQNGLPENFKSVYQFNL